MIDDSKDNPVEQDDSTLPSVTKPIVPPDLTDLEPAGRQGVARAASKLASSSSAPWLLQQFFNDQIDLSTELHNRFPSLPLMSVIRFRNADSKSPRGVATLATADGSATAVIDVDGTSGGAHLSFTYGSMLSLHFRMDELSNMDRARWLELMRREAGGVAFLWGQARWERDYVICVTRRKFASLYAFSHHGFEAAVRLTPDVAQQLLDWLERFWKSEAASGDAPNLLTW
jgi:hypothetical protein